MYTSQLTCISDRTCMARCNNNKHNSAPSNSDTSNAHPEKPDVDAKFDTNHWKLP